LSSFAHRLVAHELGAADLAPSRRPRSSPAAPAPRTLAARCVHRGHHAGAIWAAWATAPTMLETTSDLALPPFSLSIPVFLDLSRQLFLPPLAMFESQKLVARAC
jgi:hypothetical protein